MSDGKTEMKGNALPGLPADAKINNSECENCSRRDFFAKLGIGWTRAGDLTPGDLILTKSGCIRVDAVELGPEQVVWNLGLSGSHTYFAGRLGMIVHDNSPIVDRSR